ncbi:glycosyltransferase family 4 protein [Cyclobacterium jeungdonense]|uniref:Glycosyltransferase family 4 protein n=1 Tax=Cyclobacterium jeungdonense TaxID=708087 RepID=A0ABT8C398_9BACT|nr:glycosyltransferase family 4 protein [Cyclobacterium jeungdonense]MDN3686557.1 glycosyltransferase family 4 protein [Cyclobacterium jeungdonense]
MKVNSIKTLYVTNMYPTKEHPVDGIFIKEQIQDLSEKLPFLAEIVLIDSVYKGKKEYLKSIFSIPKIIQSKAFDLIHIHYGLSGLFLLFFKPQQKVFLTLHGSDIQKRKKNGWQVWLTKRILSKVDQVFVQNEAMKNLVFPYNQKVEVLTCGVDAEFFRPEPQLKSERNSKLVLFPSSPKREVKDFPLFTKVIDRVKKMVPYEIDTACIDQLSRSEVKSLLSKADCLLLTSKTEGSPQVVKEALCCSLPVVAVPVGDVKEIVEGLPNCPVASSHDVEELANLLIKTLNEERGDIRKAFLKKGKYQHQSIAETMAMHYLRVLDKNFAETQPMKSVTTVC